MLAGTANRSGPASLPGTLELESTWDEHDDLGEAIEELGGRLSPEAKDSLQRIGVLMAVGLREAEIAEALDLRVGEVNARIKRLREELDGDNPRAAPEPPGGAPLAVTSDRFHEKEAPPA